MAYLAFSKTPSSWNSWLFLLPFGTPWLLPIAPLIRVRSMVQSIWAHLTFLLSRCTARRSAGPLVPKGVIRRKREGVSQERSGRRESDWTSDASTLGMMIRWRSESPRHRISREALKSRSCRLNHRESQGAPSASSGTSCGSSWADSGWPCLRNCRPVDVRHHHRYPVRSAGIQARWVQPLAFRAQ